MDFRRVRLKGRFDHEHEVYILNKDKRLGIEAYTPNLFQRLLNATFPHHARLFKRDPGCWVVTPFILESDGKTRILVNRGWVPDHLKDPSTRPAGQVTGTVELVGYVRLQDESHSVYKRLRSLLSSSRGDYWYRDIEGIASDLAATPVWIDVDRPSSLALVGDGLSPRTPAPLGGQTSLEYFNDAELESWTFAGLFLTSSFLWYVKFIGPIRHRAF